MAGIEPKLQKLPGSGGAISTRFLTVIPVEPFTREMGVLAARIDATLRQTGLSGHTQPSAL